MPTNGVAKDIRHYVGALNCFLFSNYNTILSYQIPNTK